MLHLKFSFAHCPLTLHVTNLADIELYSLSRAKSKWNRACKMITEIPCCLPTMRSGVQQFQLFQTFLRKTFFKETFFFVIVHLISYIASLTGSESPLVIFWPTGVEQVNSNANSHKEIGVVGKNRNLNTTWLIDWFNIFLSPYVKWLD